MPKTHRVRQGECIDSIAFENGFFPETLWNDAANGELKRLRGDPNVLLPGDVVVVPDKRIKTVPLPTGTRHVFRRKGVPEKLRLRFLREGQPRAAESYVLTIDGATLAGTTDAEGRIEHWIPPNARSGRIVFGGETDAYALLLGELDPIDSVSGVQARLFALGFYDGPIDGEATPGMEEAVQEFQAVHEMEPFGVVDDATRGALRKAFGG